MRRVLEIADKELVTPRGLRTLSPGNKFYQGTIVATRRKEIKLITRETVWPWLYGPFCEGG